MIINSTDLASMDEDQAAIAGKLFLDAIVAQGMTPEAMPNLATMLHYAGQAAIEASPEIAPPPPRVIERRDNIVTVNFRRA